MSVQAISWVLDHSEATLGARLVLISIANHADKYGRDARASVASYAEEAHLSERQTRYAIRKLEELGEIRRVGQYAYRADRVVFVYEIWPFSQENARQNPPPVEIAGGQSSAVPGGKIVPTGGQPIAPKPSLNRPKTNRPEVPPSGETLGQHANRLADEYVKLEPMSKFLAVQAVMRVAIRAGRTDEEILPALARLAADQRSLTVETLRVEMDGQPPSQRRDPAMQILRGGIA